jgi:hypothetical protein
VKKKKPAAVEASPEDLAATRKQIQDTAMFMADMIQRSPPTVQTSSAAVLLSSLIVINVRPDKRLKVLEGFIADIRRHIIQANSKKQGAAQ